MEQLRKENANKKIICFQNTTNFIHVEIVKETEKAYLVESIDEKMKTWIPKVMILKKAMGPIIESWTMRPGFYITKWQ